MDRLTVIAFGALASITAAATMAVVKVDNWLARRRRDKALFGRNATLSRMLEYTPSKPDPTQRNR